MQNLKQYFGGDIQKFSENLPGFSWAKYPGEKHIPSYNYLGPGMCLDIRLDENNIPKPGEEPINAIDQLAYCQHARHMDQRGTGTSLYWLMWGNQVTHARARIASCPSGRH